ncbi:DUF3311 domain-containing protein [Haloferula rosea]|uniref:DUF3311 domain-containing protein n=1 Tax=Haloferula rosea TaxID=490093 RepID=A0A934R7Q1_9BACT|nr:DUF3311 domain-containing protein [Haloferula rosea]MBK1826799.1 DUF3311 domain-containing protein [Haloferula rosea]
MKPAVLVSTIVFIVLAVLHQDVWNWDNANLVFGFLPVGLAYHAAYSIVAATFWAIVMKIAWPTRLEEWADESND